MMLYFELGIGAVAQDDELGQSGDYVVIGHQTRLHGDTRKRDVAALEQEPVASAGQAFGNLASGRRTRSLWET